MEGELQGDVRGPISRSKVVALNNGIIKNTPPADGEVLAWDDTNKMWEPVANAGAGSDVRVAVDSGATAGYLGASSGAGVLRTSSPLTYSDGGDFVTIGLDQTALSITESQISDLQAYLTAETNDLSAAVTWANVPDANITESSVTQHEAALSITESQISDLQSYLLNITGEPLSDLSDVTITTIASNEILKWNGLAWINNTLAEAGIAAASHTHTESDITDLQAYLTAEVNDLSAAVTWANIPDANVPESAVTQHQGALSITESQVSDLQSYLLNITGEPLSDLSDVTITTIASGEILKWSGTAWINNTLAEAGIAAASHTHTKTDLTDIADFLLESEVDADIKTLSLPASTTISAFGATLVDDADAPTARTTLGVDPAGTDNSTDVTLAGTPDYITITGQTITRNTIDISDDTNLAVSSPIVLTGDTLSLDQSAVDHGSIGGLTDDDHTQYALLDRASVTNGRVVGYTSTGTKLEDTSIRYSGDDIAIGTSVDTSYRLKIKDTSFCQTMIDATGANDAALVFSQDGTQVTKLGWDESASVFKIIAGAGSFATSSFTMNSSSEFGLGTDPGSGYVLTCKDASFVQFRLDATGANDVVYVMSQDETQVAKWGYDDSESAIVFVPGSGAFSTASMKLDEDSTAGNTRLFIYDVDNGQMERVSVGAADSGGTGYKVLRIPN